MTRPDPAAPTGSRRHLITAAHDMLAAAHHDQDSVLALARELIAIPSRGGVDPGQPILDHTAAWLTDHGLPVRILRDNLGTPVGIASEIHGHQPGKRWVLDACLDTAVFGDEHAWTHSPTDPVIRDGWLWGRGSADSKTAVAIFCHLADRLHRDRDQFSGCLTLLFDLDEHTGGSVGIRDSEKESPKGLCSSAARPKAYMLQQVWCKPSMDHVSGSGAIGAR